MGWLFPYHTHERKDLIEDLVRGWETDNATSKSLAHCTRGNVLWIVQEVEAKATGKRDRCILCVLMQRSGTWGYKDMDESVHPYYYTCPEKYLDMVSVTNEEWRAKVREYHECRRARFALRAIQRKRPILPTWSFD